MSHALNVTAPVMLLFLAGCCHQPAGETVDQTVEIKHKPAPAPIKKVSFTSQQLALPGKKGACFTLRPAGHKKGGNVERNVPKVRALNVSWNYSWGPTHVAEQPKDVEFVPMTWGCGNVEKFKQWVRGAVKDDVTSGKTKRLLAFNEPDHKKQSGVPYMRAIEVWPELEALGVPLCSPACANPEGMNDDSVQGVPGTWMRDFMKEADSRGLRVDYVGVHWYGGCSPNGFKAKMQRIYEKYGRRPLMITEFAPADWKTGGDLKKNRHSPARVLAFMKDVLPWMERQDWIAGYAWFSFGIDSPQGTSSALFDKDGNLTACGKFYSSVSKENPDGDQSIEPDPKR